MTRKKILDQHDEFSKGKPLRRDYKPGTDVSIEGLKSAIIEALDEQDYDTFKGCIAMLLDKKEITRKAAFLKEHTLYRMCKPDSDLTSWQRGILYGYLDKMCKPGSSSISASKREEVKQFIKQLGEQQAA